MRIFSCIMDIFLINAESNLMKLLTVIRGKKIIQKLSTSSAHSLFVRSFVGIFDLILDNTGTNFDAKGLLNLCKGKYGFAFCTKELWGVACSRAICQPSATVLENKRGKNVAPQYKKAANPRLSLAQILKTFCV